MDTFENEDIFPQDTENNAVSAETAQSSDAAETAVGVDPVVIPPIAPIEPAVIPAAPTAAPAAEESTAPEGPASVPPVTPTQNPSYQPRRESPYANSPYMNYQPQQGYQQYRYQPQPAPVKAPKPKREGNGKSVWKPFLAIVMAIALVAGSCLVTANVVNSRWEKENARTVDRFNQQIGELEKKIDAIPTAPADNGSGNTVSSSEGMTPGQVYAQNVHSVVAIFATVRSSNMFGQVSEGQSSGSGFIISEDGYIVTNYHVIEGSSKLNIKTYAGDEYSAKVVGSDSTNDVAVLKVDAAGLPAAKIGSSDDLVIGDMVVAIGNPLGELAATQTVGFVSGKNREINTDNAIINMIQTDAAINPGNSGGPLFNMNGEVVGITTAKYSGTTSSGASIEGIGFAIPISDVQNIIRDLKDLGYVTGAYLGVTVQNTDAESAAYYGLPTGAYVVSVVEKGSADRAGVQPKDIIIQLGDYTVTSVTDLTRSLRNFKAGDTTVITVVRGGQQLELSITLDEKSQQNIQSPNIPENTEGMPSEGDFNDWYEFLRPFFEDGENSGSGSSDSSGDFFGFDFGSGRGN